MYENNEDITTHIGYFLPEGEIKNHNVMTDGQNFFDQPVKHDKRTYDNIRKIMTGQRHY